MDRKRLVALEQYLPMLDRIANNESYMHTARAKAAEMAESIRANTAMKTAGSRAVVLRDGRGAEPVRRSSRTSTAHWPKPAASPAEYLRAIEKHLQKYPNTARKEELERAAVPRRNGGQRRRAHRPLRRARAGAAAGRSPDPGAGGAIAAGRRRRRTRRSAP